MADVTLASFEEMEPIYEGLARRARASLGVTAWGMQLMTLPPNRDGYPNHVHDATVEDQPGGGLCAADRIRDARRRRGALRPTARRYGPRRAHPARANGQPALAAYAREDGDEVARAYGVMVFAIQGDRIAGITGFARRPDLFTRLGLPVALG